MGPTCISLEIVQDFVSVAVSSDDKVNVGVSDRASVEDPAPEDANLANGVQYGFAGRFVE